MLLLQISLKFSEIHILILFISILRRRNIVLNYEIKNIEAFQLFHGNAIILNLKMHIIKFRFDKIVKHQ